MLYEYGGWIIDATPNFSAGKYFARARLTRISSADGEEPEMHIERDIAWFESRDPAVQRAYQWAIGWIGEREAQSPARKSEPLV